MRASERLRRRLGRLRPLHVAPAGLVWVIASWIASLGLVVIVLMPDFTDSVSVEGSGVIATFQAPRPFRIALLAAASVVAGASVVWALLREQAAHAHRTLDTWAREAIILAVALVPALVLLADGARVRALFAAVVAVVVIVLAHVPRVRGAGVRGPALLGLLAAIPWLSLIPYQLTEAGSSSRSWLWMGLFGAAAAFAAFGSYYGVARAAESRTGRLGFLYRADLNPLLVLGIVAAGAIIVVLRLTVARELFPEPDPELWSPFGREPISWAIALLVGGTIAVIAVRASRRPLAPAGEHGVVAYLAALGNLELIGSMLTILLGIAVAIVTSTVFLPTSWLVAVPWIKFGGVVVLAIAMLLPRFRGTAARWIGLASAVFLAATTLDSGLVAAGAALPDFSATPVQVVLILLAAAFALAIWNAVNRGRRVNPGLAARLAIVPLIAVHAGWLLPAIWSELGRIVVVVGVIVALLWLMPPVAADRRRHTLNVVGASLAQLLALLVFVLAIPSLFADGALTVLGLLWLSIPVIAGLTIDTRERSGEPAADQ